RAGSVPEKPEARHGDAVARRDSRRLDVERPVVGRRPQQHELAITAGQHHLAAAFDSRLDAGGEMKRYRYGVVACAVDHVADDQRVPDVIERKSPGRADATGEALITRVGADEHVLLDAGCPAPYVWRRVVVQRPEMIPADETIEFAAIDLRCVVGGR